jgi:hypothetical protein
MEKIKDYFRSFGIPGKVVDEAEERLKAEEKKKKEVLKAEAEKIFKNRLGDYLAKALGHPERYSEDVIEEYFESRREKIDSFLDVPEFEEKKETDEEGPNIKVPYDFKRHLIRWFKKYIDENEDMIVSEINSHFIRDKGERYSKLIEESIQEALHGDKKHKLWRWIRGFDCGFEKFIDKEMTKYQEQKPLVEILREFRKDPEYLVLERVQKELNRRLKKDEGLEELAYAVKEEIFNVMDSAEREDELDFHYLDKLKSVVEEFGLRMVYSSTELDWLKSNISYETIGLLEEKLGETPVPEVEQTALTFPETPALATVSPLEEDF